MNMALKYRTFNLLLLLDLVVLFLAFRPFNFILQRISASIYNNT